MHSAIREYYGSPLSSEGHSYRRNEADFIVQRQQPGINTFHPRNIKHFLKAVFLPKGYPDSVSEDYLQYQVWDTLQAFCSSITRTLAAHAVLKGSGVGDSAATVAGATITWLLKDGTGMVGRIAFAYAKGSSLDCNAKQWRMFADVLNDGATFVELLAPVLPKAYFTPIMCAAGLAYSLVGVAGGCTRAALTVHQARRNNMADVSSKDGSQETLVNLAALVASLIITPIVADHFALTWTLFILFTMLHIYANYKAVSSVVMDIFNKTRFFNVAASFVLNRRRVLTPSQANKLEPVFHVPNFSWLKLGCRIEDLKITSVEFDYQVSSKKPLKFLIKADRQTGRVYVALAQDATSHDILRACYHSYLLHMNMTSYQANEDEFVDAVKSVGWDLTKQHLCPEEWRWSLEETSHTMYY